MFASVFSIPRARSLGVKSHRRHFNISSGKPFCIFYLRSAVCSYNGARLAPGARCPVLPSPSARSRGTGVASSNCNFLFYTFLYDELTMNRQVGFLAPTSGTTSQPPFPRQNLNGNAVQVQRIGLLDESRVIETYLYNHTK